MTRAALPAMPGAGSAAGTVWRAAASTSLTRIVPDGVIDLMYFQGAFVVAGPDTTAALVPTEPGEVTWGLPLRPGEAHALFGVPAAELTDRRVRLDDLAPGVRVRHRDPDREPAAALAAVRAALWARAEPDAALLRLAASLDRAARAGVSIATVAASHGLSIRTLQRTSDRLFGYGPKTLMRIHRFQHGSRLLAAGQPIAVAAALAGYVDQSHFNREVRALAGRTPGELAAAGSRLSDSSNPAPSAP